MGGLARKRFLAKACMHAEALPQVSLGEGVAGTGLEVALEIDRAGRSSLNSEFASRIR